MKGGNNKMNNIKIINVLTSIITGIIFSSGTYNLSHFLFKLLFNESLSNITLIMDIPLGIIFGIVFYQLINIATGDKSDD